MTETLCTSGAVKYKAGANVSSTITEDPVAMTQFINQAEGTISTICRNDFVTDYAGISVNYSKVLEEACSNLAASYCIIYDMSGFSSRYEAETMLDGLRDGALRAISVLREIPTQEFLGVK